MIGDAQSENAPVIERSRNDRSGAVSDSRTVRNDWSVNAETANTASANPWLVLRTKVKCEKFVRDQLHKLNIEAFVPLKLRTARYQRKVVTFEHPLITTYTFARFDRDRKNQVLALPYVQGILRMDGKECTVPQKEINWLQKISGTDLDVRAEMLSLLPGDRVMLACGQLAGMEGTLVSHRSKHEVCVALESLGLQMVIQVDKSMIVRA